MPWREPDREPGFLPTEPFIVDGHVIPPGTIVVVNNYCLMHNEAYFPDPFAFRPERWLEEEEQENDEGGDNDSNKLKPKRNDAQRNRAAFVPFGLGEAVCLGKGLAYLETSLVVAKTLWYFDFAQAPGEAGRLGGGWSGAKDEARARVDEFQLYDGIVSDHDGPGLVFEKRSGASWEGLGGV